MSEIERILVGVDFSDCSRAALRFAFALGNKLGARVDVLHVLAPPPYVPLDLALWQETDRDLSSRVLASVEQFVAETAPGGAERAQIRVEAGVPYETLVTAAEEADLVVVGTHGRTGLPHLLLGSVAERVVRLSPCPVVTVRVPRGGERT